MQPIDNSQKTIDHLKRIFENLDKYWHSIQLLLGHVSKPLLVDDRGLQNVLRDIFEKNKETLSIMDNLLKKMKDLDIVQTLSEIKYIGARLNNIENALKHIQEKGIKKNIELEFRCDGYEMVKKPINYVKEDPIAKSNDDYMAEVLNELSELESKVLIHRFGLNGDKPKTLAAIGRLLKVSGERVRTIEAKALRKLRMPHRKKLRDKITHKELRKAVFGE